MKCIFVFGLILSLFNQLARSEEWQMSDRFEVKDGLVKDPAKGLMWMRCSLGQNWDGQGCSKDAAEYRWYEAMNNLPKYIEYAGYNNWRLPTPAELYSLVYCRDTEATVIMSSDNCAEDIKASVLNNGKPGVAVNPTTYDVFPQTPKGYFHTSSQGTVIGFNANYPNEINYSNEKHPDLANLHPLHVRLVRNLIPVKTSDTESKKWKIFNR